MRTGSMIKISGKDTQGNSGPTRIGRGRTTICLGGQGSSTVAISCRSFSEVSFCLAFNLAVEMTDISYVLGDYVGAILGLVRDQNDWRLDPLKEFRRAQDHVLSPRGEGNVVSIEFNLLYRWHAGLSRNDTAWTEKKFESVLGEAGKKPADLTKADFMKAVGKAAKELGTDVKRE
jgi:hypothetical protein